VNRSNYSAKFFKTRATVGGLFLSLAITPAAFSASQTIYEAEASQNLIGGTADIGYCSACSGTKNVQNLGGPGGGSLQFNGVNIASQGSYPVTITYDNGSSGSLTASVLVNGTASQTVSFPPTGSWSKLSTVTASLPFSAGNNSITFTGNNRSWVAEIDQISVQSPDTPSPAPAPSSASAPAPAPASSPASAPAPAPAPSSSVSAPGNSLPLSTFGPAGQGGDDTRVIQTAINSTAANGQTLEIPTSAAPYNVQPLTIPSNAKIFLDADVTIQATSGYSSSQRMVNIVDVSNVSITGTPGRSTFQMRKSEYTSGEYRHCLDIEGSNSVTVTGIACNNSGGDGLYIGEGRQGFSSNITVSQSTFDNNRRQGFSLISGKNIVIDNCVFSHTNGTAPEAGVDVEPNVPSDVLQNIVFTNNKSIGNHGAGFMSSVSFMSNASAPVSISVSNHSTSGNTGSGYFATDERDDGVQGVSGTITIQNSASTNDAQYGAVASYHQAGSVALKFQNLTVTNANASNSTYDGAAIGIKRGGGGQTMLGGVTFTGTSISGSNGMLQHYFTVEDYSKVGLSSIFIGDFGSLSGIPATNSAGIVNGLSVNSVNIP
jgi:hypothetical protein